ncbi:YhfZ family protein [Salicibibacter kimchii]|nr:YhfZ family protein [Salicibibacter kimchii]
MPLSNQTDANTEAVLIVRKDCDSLQDLILQLIDPQQVIETQRRVIEREITPMF